MAKNEAEKEVFAEHARHRAVDRAAVQRIDLRRAVQFFRHADRKGAFRQPDADQPGDESRG